MFEDSLFSSKPQPATPRSRWITALSIAIQLALLAVVLLVPLLTTQSLPRLVSAPMPVRLDQPRTPPKPVKVQTSTAMKTIRVPAAQQIYLCNSMPSHIPKTTTNEAAPTLISMTGTSMTGTSMNGDTGLPTGLGNAGTGIHVTSGGGRGNGSGSGPDKGKRIAVSSGVTTGMLLAPIQPTYPAIARMTHTQGTVVVTAIIDRNGRITALHVLSGPPMLQNAALDAIRIARYRPYLLNGEPTEVETTISVNFRMDS